MAKGYKLTWRGNEVLRIVEEQAVPIMTDIGLTAVNDSKAELYPGHGRVTSTLRRSIQIIIQATPQGKRVVVRIGSNLEYAMAIHQGWSFGYEGLKGAFEGYHYLTKGVERTRAKVSGIVKKHALRGTK